MKKIRLLILVCCTMLSHPALSLNIVLTNDDGWMTENIKTLKETLTTAGHDVVIVAPCAGQSAKGGSVFLFKPIPVDTSRAKQNEYCVGDTDTNKSFQNFGDGTPATAVYYALDVVVPARWGADVDLLISGPNEGANTGIAIQVSGTINAAMVAISRGIPALAVSAHEITTTNKAESHKVASIILDLLSKLEKSRAVGEPILPLHMGLNINLPRDLDDHKGVKFAHTGWAYKWHPRFSTDMSNDVDLLARHLVNNGRAKSAEEAHDMLKPLRMGLAGKGGIVLGPAKADLDADENSEGSALAAGHITISTLEANGERNFTYMKARLSEI